MNSRWLMLVIAFGGMVAPPSPSRAAEKLSLAEAVRIALRENPDVLRAGAQSDAAEAARSEAGSLRLPHVQIRETALRTDSPADVFGLELMQERFSFSSFVASDPNQPDPIDNFATEFEAVWPIYMGGRVMAGIGQAERAAIAAGAMHGYTREAIALAAASAYTNAVLAERSVELAQRARDTTARHVDQASAFFDTGMIVESDLLQARAQLAYMEERLIGAKNAGYLARAQLFRTLGISQDTDYELDESVAAPEPTMASLGEALARADSLRLDVRAVAAQSEAARFGVKRAQGEYLPEVTLLARYSLNDDQIFGSNGESYALMAMATWNPWDWGQTRARVRAARSNQVAAEQIQRSHSQQVEYEVREAWNRVQEARARIDVASRAVAHAEKALAILDDRFEQGVTRVTDLLDAETMLDDARLRELNARFDLQRATRTLDFAVGLPPVPEVLP